MHSTPISSLCTNVLWLPRNASLMLTRCRQRCDGAGDPTALTGVQSGFQGMLHHKPHIYVVYI